MMNGVYIPTHQSTYPREPRGFRGKNSARASPLPTPFSIPSLAATNYILLREAGHLYISTMGTVYLVFRPFKLADTPTI
jgi:hypothetical protein